MSLRVAHVNCVMDPQDRAPEDLLAAWPTLQMVPAAAAAAGAKVTVLQSARRAASYSQGEVMYQFIAEPRQPGAHRSGLAPWRLTTALRRLRPDVIHFNGLDFPLHLRAACAAGPPVLVQDHASAPSSTGWRLRRWALAGAAGIAFTAGEQATPFRQAGQIPAGLEVFEIAESSTSFTPGSREEARQQTGVFGDPALLWVGHLDSNKDPLTILRAMRAALATLPDAQLWCAYASAPLLPQVTKALSADADLAARVHLLGRVDHSQIEQLCRACDMFVLASHSEGSGYALMEALACGLPPVISDIPSFRRLMGDGRCGALAAPGDWQAFARGMVEVAGRPREATRQCVADHFTDNLSPRALGQLLVAVYGQLASRGMRP